MPQAARTVLWCAAAFLAAAIAFRLFHGPYVLLGFPINAPINPEGAFGLLITAVIVWKVSRPTGAPSPQLWPILAAAALALIALSPATRLPFLSDDFIIVQQARAWSAADIWGELTHGGGDGFFRPLGYLSWAVDAMFAGTDPTRWHVLGLLLHIANSALVTLVARRLGASNMAAFLAGAIFALHGAHLEAAAWIAGRFDLLATCFTLLALLTFARSTILSLAFTAAALLSKESAYILPALLGWLAWRERRGWRPVVPYLAIALIAFAYRWILVGGIGGYRTPTGTPQFLDLRPIVLLKTILVRVWTSLYFPINWSAEPGALLLVLYACYLAVLLWLAWKTRPEPGIRAALGMLVVSILPPLQMLAGSSDLSGGGRLLYLPSVFLCILLALAVQGLDPGTPRSRTVAIAAIILAFHAAALHHDFSFWRSTGVQVEKICRQAATGPRPASLPKLIDGVPALANGFDQCVEAVRGSP